MDGMYAKLAMFAIRCRKWVIGCWLALAAFSLPLAARLSDVLGDHGLVTEGSHRQALARLERDFGMPAEPVLMLFEPASGARDPQLAEKIGQALERADRISGVAVAASPLERAELWGDSRAYAVLSVPESIRQRRQAVEQLRQLAAEYSGLNISLTGKPVVQEDVNRRSRGDLMAAELLGVPAAFAVMLLAFGGARPAIVPLIAGGMAVAIAMAAVRLIGAFGFVPLSVFVHNVIPMAGMAVCLDFALLIVSRYREERAASSAREAVMRAMVAAGKTVTVSAACACAAMVGMFFIPMPMFRSVALSAIVVLALSWLISLTFVPALLYA